jgi:hypothetical protein
LLPDGAKKNTAITAAVPNMLNRSTFQSATCGATRRTSTACASAMQMPTYAK